MKKEEKLKGNKTDYTACVLLDGVPLEVIKHDGKDYISVEPGQKFSISVTNHTEHLTRAVVEFNNFTVYDDLKPDGTSLFTCIEIFSSN